ncbi:hypothetical protein JCM10212_001465 [Sporobolomyces blumeae]
MEEALGWIVAAGFCYAAYRIVFGSSSSSLSARRQVPQAAIDQVRTLFPHVSARSARWELERNGGSVERAVERALREGGLPEPPASYFPPDPQDFPQGSGSTTPRPGTPQPHAGGGAPAGMAGRAAGATTGSSSGLPARVPPPSLIKRLGLQSQLAQDDEAGSLTPSAADVKGKGKAVEGESAERGGTGQAGGWAASREEREERLRKRKEKLVLEARRKLLEKERKSKQEPTTSDDAE